MLVVGLGFKNCLGGLRLESHEVIEVLFDFLDDVELALTNLRNRLARLKGVNERVWSWDPSKIKWEPAEGFRGEYERSEDFNNREFKKMVRDLARHGGKLTREGYFYWLFENGSTVGRKKRIKNDKSSSNPYEKMENILKKLKNSKPLS